MPAPAAASPLPLTILVLAWDEAAPAVRTLIEAAPSLVAAASIGPLLVLTPPTPEAPTTPAEAAAVPAEAAAPSPTPLAPARPPVTAAAVPPATRPVAAAAPPEAPSATAISGEAAATRPAGWTAVRVTRLAYPEPSQLSQFASLAPVAFPTAPYLGATPPPPSSIGVPTVATAAPPMPVATPASLPVSIPAADATLPGHTPAAPAPAAPEGPTPETYTTDEALAPDLEADLLPMPAAAEVATPLAPAQPAGATTFFPVADQAEAIQPDISDSLSLDAEALAEPALLAAYLTSELPTLDAAEPLDSSALTDDEPAPADALPTGRSIAEPAAIASPPLLPVAGHYPAPDLNTQVIRYARFAVPAALAEGPFTAIYAPAWPTWLAALELRQRTGCPLVLHLPALAAGREPADTAAGWPAEIQRQALRQADLILTETYALARRLRRELGLASTTVRVVPAADGSAIARALRRARRREVAR